MHSSLTLLLVQIAVILAASRLMGKLFRRIHQPQVIGEMVAGIMLGPSLLGWLAPNLSARLFPPASLEYLNILSQIGLILFMFLVGLELDPLLLRGRRRAAIVISNASIIAPFLLGAGLAIYLYPRLSGPPVSLIGFTLFLGAAMSVTAFPVLARILSERNMLRSKVGVLAIACAAVNDVTAWCILAVVIAIVRAGQTSFPVWLTIAGSTLFVLIMVVAVRPALRYVETRHRRIGRLTQSLTAKILLLVLVAAWTTEWLGIHALFGAFVAGAVMPKDHAFVRELTEKLEHLTVAFLLPLFFALAGLRASIGLLSGLQMWFYCALILFVAVLGKFGGSTLAARWSGLSWREAGALGILMNTRGLVELVILNIGFDLGIISPAVYTMMLLMALISTFMASPLLEQIYPTRLIQREFAWATVESRAATGAQTLEELPKSDLKNA
jgi:Kef-type K+ transport system membrane component KefB